MNQNNNQRNYLFDNVVCSQFCFIVESNTSSSGHMHAGVGANPFPSNIRIGSSCQPGAYNEGFIGHIGEFIVFDRVLKVDEYLEVEKYLSTKWGIKF